MSANLSGHLSNHEDLLYSLDFADNPSYIDSQHYEISD